MSDIVPADDAPTLPALRPDDLTLVQEIAYVGSITQACKNLGLTRREASNRLKRPEVKRALDQIIGKDDVEYAKRELSLLTGEVGKTIEDVLNAEMTKQVIISCPKCGHGFTHSVQVIAYATKLKAAETLMKFSKLLQPSVKVDMDATVNHRVTVEMTTPQRLALEKLHRGQAIPGYMYAELEKLARLDNFELPPNPGAPKRLNAAPEVVEGDYREVSDDDIETDTSEQQ